MRIAQKHHDVCGEFIWVADGILHTGFKKDSRRSEKQERMRHEGKEGPRSEPRTRNEVLEEDQMIVMPSD